MAKIAEYLKQILSARYGREVRQSIHDAISAINDESTECWATVEKVPETLAIAAVKDRVSGKDITLPLSSDFVATDFKAGGNTEQDTTSGKNLLDCSGLTTTTTNGITFTPKYDDKGLLEYINVNGTSSAVSIYGSVTQTYKAGSYIVSGGANQSAVLQVSDATKEIGRAGDSDYTLVLDTDMEITTRIRLASNYTANNLKFYPMIRDASIADGTYEPFTNGASPNPSYPQEIKSVVLSEIRTCGKNVFSGVPFEENVYYSLENAKIALDTWDSYVLSVTGGKSYTVSGIDTTSSSTGFLAFENDTFLSAISYYQNGTFNVPTNCNKLKYSVRKNGKDAFMIEEGEVATEYEPYTESVATLSEPITLNGLNGVSDYIDVKRGVLVQKFIKRSNLKFTLVSGYTIGNSELFGCGAGDGANKGIIVSNVLPFEHHGILNNNINGAYQLYNVLYARIQGVSDVNEFNNLIADNEFVYELKEPIETPLPDADLEALKNIRTFKGTTHVFTDSEVKPDLEVEYVCDTKMYIDAKIAELQ